MDHGAGGVEVGETLPDKGVVGLQGGGVTLKMEPRNGLERVPGARIDHPLPLKVSN